MVIIDTYTKRQKRLRGTVTDVCTYDEFPRALRVQICNIWARCFGIDGRDYIGRNPAYQYLHTTLADEFGLFAFPNSDYGDQKALMDFFLQDADIDQTLDMIEHSFRGAYLFHNQNEFDLNQWRETFQVKCGVDEAVDDLNARFLQHGVGYRFVLGDPPQLLRISSEHLHKEAVIPALELLHDEGFKGASDEYRKAHEHYRHGRQKECLNECLKAFESTMKIICKTRKWPHKETDTAKNLIDTCLKNGLLPTFMQSHLTTIAGALDSAIPTMRNKMGGHGQGAEPKTVPEYYAEYLLHETAVTIVFMVEAYKAIK